MNPSDAAELLTLAAAFDRRTIGKADAIAWADALTGLDPNDCAEAIRAHFRDSTDYLMPAHVRRGVRKIRADRVRAADSSLLDPHDVDPADVGGYLAARRARIAAIASGRAVEREPIVPADRERVERLMHQTLAALPAVPRPKEATA